MAHPCDGSKVWVDTYKTPVTHVSHGSPVVCFRVGTSEPSPSDSPTVEEVPEVPDIQTKTAAAAMATTTNGRSRIMKQNYGVEKYFCIKW